MTALKRSHLSYSTIHLWIKLVQDLELLRLLLEVSSHALIALSRMMLVQRIATYVGCLCLGDCDRAIEANVPC